MKLEDVAYYVNEKIDISKLNVCDYVSTDSMIPGKAGIIDSESLPTGSRVTRYKPSDTLVSNIRPYFNKIWYATKESGCSNDVIVFRSTDPDSYDPKFLYYVLSQDSFFGHMMAGANGTKMPRGNKKLIPEFLVPDFEICTQRRIANVLSAYDNLIENNQKQIKLLEEAAQRLYKEWFVDLRFPGYENTKIVDGVPEGWSEKRLFELACLLKRGISPRYNPDGKFWVINQKCIRTFIMDMSEARKQEKEYSNDLNLIDSDIVVCSTGIGTLGRVGQVFGECQSTTFDSHVTTIRAIDGIEKQFLYLSVKSKQPDLMNMGRGSTNQQELYKEVIANLKVLVPPHSIRKRFEITAQAIHDKITKQVSVGCRLQQARDRLLPKLMSGEIEV